MTQRDWGKYGLGAAAAGWVVAAFPAVSPVALALWAAGLVVSIAGRRRTRSGYGLAGIIVASLGLAWVLVGITLGLVFF